MGLLPRLSVARTVRLVANTAPALVAALAGAAFVAAVMPALAAWAGRHVIDAVMVATEAGREDPAARAVALRWVIFEGVLLGVVGALRPLQTLFQSMLAARLSYRVGATLMARADSLPVEQLEDPAVQDVLLQARRDATTRPVTMTTRLFDMMQNGVAMIATAVILVTFSWTAVGLLVIAAIPGFVAQTRFAGVSFRFHRSRSGSMRERSYLETLLTREDHARERIALGIGGELRRRYDDLFSRLWDEDRAIQSRRAGWAALLGVLSTASFYVAYAWCVHEAVARTIGLGELTMYVALFRQGQNALSAFFTALGGVYEDDLFVSSYHEFVDLPVASWPGTATRGVDPSAGLKVENVTFTYPGGTAPALRDVSFEVRPGETLALIGGNGSGKSTALALIYGFYRPEAGRVMLDGRALTDWDLVAFRRRIASVFQNFLRFKMRVRDNVAFGDLTASRDDDARIARSLHGAGAEFVEGLPGGLEARLGRTFGGEELSGGQWQRLAVARAMFAENADIRIYDEPTSAVDAASEAPILERLLRHKAGAMTIIVTHRLSSARLADRIVFLDAGRVAEYGTHDELMALDGRYARLFASQAEGYLTHGEAPDAEHES
jgi:ATP-binding cassette subfamily B protein